MKRLSTAILFAAIACTPLLVQADDHDRDHRYYDRSHKDYHEWNNDEDRAWHHYAESQHLKVSDWNRANKRQQEAYWRWRHDHQGNDWDRH